MPHAFCLYYVSLPTTNLWHVQYFSNLCILALESSTFFWLIQRICDANMRVFMGKTKFFKESVEYIGFELTNEGTKTDPEKVKAIQEYADPKNLFALTLSWTCPI